MNLDFDKIFKIIQDFCLGNLVNRNKIVVQDATIIDQWKEDYTNMQATMIYGDSLPFNKLIDRIKQLNETVNKMDW